MAAPLFPIMALIAKKGVEAAIKKYGKTAVKKAQEASKNQPTPKYMRDQKGPSIADRERAATAARKTRNRVAAGTVGAAGAAGSTYELMKRVGREEMEKKGIKPSKTPLRKSKGGMANKRTKSTKWETKWG